MATIVAAAGAAGNWSVGSAWVGGIAPTAADDAQIGATTTSLTIDATAVCRSADFTGFTGTLTAGSTAVLAIGDATAGASNIALKMPSGFTFAPNVTANIFFVSTSATLQTISCDSGYSMCNMTLNNTGKYAITSNLTINTSDTLTFSKGELHTDGTTDNAGLTHSWGIFNANNSNTKVINYGNSTINFTANNPYTISPTGTTLTCGTSTLNFNATGGSTITLAALTYNNIKFEMGTAVTQTSGAFTCANMTINGGANKTGSFGLGTTAKTITGTLTINANSAINRILVAANAFGAGTTSTVTAANVVITNIVDFMDVIGAGAATWTVAGTGATALGDCGGNSGITFSSSSANLVRYFRR
jgi:hypothetical protein